MTTASRFTRFLDNLGPDPKQYEDAKTKYDGVASKLHATYYPGTRFDGTTRKIIGAYGKGTAVKPPRDVDILFLMPASTYQTYNQRSGNAQSQLLQDIRAVLLAKYPSTEIRGDGQVVVAPFANGHSVEIVPSWRTSTGRFIVPNTHDGGSWLVVDQDAEIAQIADSDKASAGNTRRLIKMLKAWQRQCNVPIKTLVLELRAVNFLKNWKYRDKGATYYDWMVRDFFEHLIGYADGTCKMPGTDEKIHYGKEWLTRAESALARARAACDYEARSEERLAVQEWQKIFGSQYEL